MSQDDMNRQAFKEEAQDLLAELETALLELEEYPEDEEIIARVFRAMHTIKGSGAMFGFDDIAAFTHEVETVFDRVRNGEMTVTKELLDLTLASRDQIAAMLAATEGGPPVDIDTSARIIAGLKELSPDNGEEEPVPGALPDVPVSQEDIDDLPMVTYRVRFKPHRDIMQMGGSPLGLLEELGELGTMLLFTHTGQLPPLAEMDPEECFLWWDIVLATKQPMEAIRDVFMFVEDDSDILIKEVDKEGLLESDEDYMKLGEILVERGDVAPGDLKKIIDSQKRIGDVLTDAGLVDKEHVEAALAEQQAVREIRKKRTDSSPQASSIRVAADKLDQLVDLVGELVIVQAQITQMAVGKGDPMLLTLSEQLERLSDELRDSTLGIRMLPIGTTFSKFRRLVRDLSGELGKEIELTTEGAETELDKTVIERLNDPLVHLLRNSIDHGVEMPADRTANGKKAAGKIHLSAEHSGGEVLIRIVDDGKGIDPDIIRKKAVERGLMSADSELPTQEILGMIFQPGFSTAEKVTSVSGRGVGMDVVKRSIESLRGTVVIDSELGKGTTITVKLPLTLAIIDGLQVQVDEDFFVLPLALVEECVELVHKTEDKSREQIVNLRGEIVPYIRLRELFELPGDTPQIEQIVVAGLQGTRVGVVVDNVIGEHQTVIKSLGRFYRDVEGVSGATIKGDGSMALILDVPKLVQLAADAQQTVN